MFVSVYVCVGGGGGKGGISRLGEIKPRKRDRDRACTCARMLVSKCAAVGLTVYALYLRCCCNTKLWHLTKNLNICHARAHTHARERALGHTHTHTNTHTTHTHTGGWIQPPCRSGDFFKTSSRASKLTQFES